MEAPKEIKEEEIPIQAQIQYIDSEGIKHLRVVSKTIKKTKDGEEYAKTYDPEISAAMRVQQAGRAAYKGDKERAEELIEGYQKQIAVAPMAPGRAKSVSNALKKELKQLQSLAFDSEDKKAAESAKQMRRTQKELFE
ncbi:MAG: hypothetical protein ACUVXA_04425 [Candidatus Jordarchaeum sp.]|uniref:hypothetical protein n=1 Tax=Candidatus Jordarchaeum sp. TaxID=2823881 RepID=UPI00404A5949